MTMKKINEKEKQEEFWFGFLRKGDLQEFWSPQIKVLFLLKGSGQIHFTNMKTVYTVKEEDIFVINSFEMWNLELEENAAALSFSISLRFASAVNPELLKYPINCRSFLYGEEEQESFDALRIDFAKAFKAQYKSDNQPPAHLNSKAVALLEDLVRYFLDRNQVSASRGTMEALKPAISYIQSHYRENITLENLVEETFLSRTYISRSFTKYFGISFTDYVTLLRVAYAGRMLQGKSTISEIAFESGFPNVNAMILAFKRHWGITPGEYRKKQRSKGNADGKANDFHENETGGMFASLMKFAAKTVEAEPAVVNMKEICVEPGGRKQRVTPHWKRILNAGYARSVADGTLQREIRYLKEKVGFEYIRLKGILDDDMCLLRRDMNGKIIVNYAYIDETLDFILSVGAKPMVELGCMPGLLAQNPTLSSMRRGIYGVPSDIEKWQELIGGLMEHLVSRYTKERVRQWLFAPWIPPDFTEFGLCSLTEYEEIYAASCNVIKTIDPNFLVTGPGTTDPERYLKWYLDMGRRKNCLPDVLTFRSFATGTEEEKDEMNLIGNNESFPLAVSGDENLIQNTVNKIKCILREEGLSDIPLILEEWSNNIWQRDLCNDTCYKSAYLFKNILENNQDLNGMGYFTLNDRIDEVPPSADTFHGGFGLFTKNHIPKSACRAMELLGQMGDRLLCRGEGYYITRSEEEIQIFLYNYSHYDLLYRYRHVVNMSKTKRYNVFVSKEAQAFYIRLENMKNGSYQVRRYSITREGGSSYDAWVKMGAPEPLDREEEEMLRVLSRPLYRRENVEVKDGILGIKASLNPQDVCLIKIKIL